MDLAALHLRLSEITPAAISRGDDPELAAIEAHAATGCSRCARALVDARETTVDVAIAAHMPARPSADLRARILARAHDVALPRAASDPPRFFDVSGEVARLHARGAEDAARVAEVDALSAALPREGDVCEQLLAQMGRITGFPLSFVSVVRGERVGYRAQRGLDVRFAEMRDRRRETTFCTHAISSGAPLVVCNAAAEPFFRGSNMVRRFGVHAYVGVALTTSRDVAIGTVCAMDFRARTIDASVVRVLELFTEPVLAEIEAARRAPEDRLARIATAPLHGAPWMRALIDAERCLARTSARPSTMIVARDAERLARLAGVDEALGHLDRDAFALLLPGVSAAEGEARLAADANADANVGAPFARVVPCSAHAQGAAWCEAAVAALS